MDRLRALSYFIKVAETGSFSRAAKSFGVPASSISRRIQGLETELGAALLQRTTRSVQLTSLGALYLDQINPAISALAHADDIIREQNVQPSGRLRVTAIPGYGGFCLVPALKKLRRLYPGLIVDLELTDQVSNLTNNDVDLAVRGTANPPDRLVARKLSDNEFVLVGSPEYLDRHGAPQTLDDLNDHKSILYRRPDDILQWQAKTADGWRTLETTPAFISNMGEHLLEEAIAGRGLALIPAWSVGDHLAENRLIQIYLEDGHLAISRNENSGIYLLYQRPKYDLAKIRTVVDFLLAELTSQAQNTRDPSSH